MDSKKFFFQQFFSVLIILREKKHPKGFTTPPYPRGQYNHRVK